MRRQLLAMILILTPLACGRGEPNQVARLATFCELSRELNRVPLAADATSPEGAGGTLRQFYSEPAQQANLQKIGDVAPAEIRGDVELVTKLRREIAESGDVSALAAPETQAAVARVQTFEQIQC